MKVIIINNYGGRIPKELMQFVSGDIAWRWSHAVSYLETHAIPAEKGESANAQIVRYLGPDPNTQMYLFKADNLTVSIVDVDIKRKWTIERYDGAEYIQYLDFTIVNECVGYCILPKN